MTPLEGALNTERFRKDVELNLLLVGIFISFPSCLVYPGERGAIIVWRPVYSTHFICCLINFFQILACAL